MSYRIECFFEIDRSSFSERLMRELANALYAEYKRDGVLSRELTEEELEAGIKCLYNDGKGLETVNLIDGKARGGFVFVHRGTFDFPVKQTEFCISVGVQSVDTNIMHINIPDDKVVIKICDQEYFLTEDEQLMDEFLKTLLIAYKILMPNWGRIGHELAFDATRKERFNDYLFSGIFLKPEEVARVGKKKLQPVILKAWKTFQLSDGGTLIILGVKIVQRNPAISDGTRQEIAKLLGLKTTRDDAK